MPHVPEDARTRLRAGGLIKAGDVGELCFIFADWALSQYNELPKWRTIHAIRCALSNPFQFQETRALIEKHGTAYEKADILVAADLAFMEFYRLVGGPHEDCKVIENGNCFAGAKIPVPSLQGTEDKGARGKGRKGKADDVAV